MSAKNARKRRAYILERDGHRCVYCGSTDRLTIDHVIPRAVGGTNDRCNLQTLCEDCNNRKADTYHGRRFPTLRQRIEVPDPVLEMLEMAAASVSTNGTDA